MNRLFVFALVLLLGCGDKKVSPPPPVANASGTWAGTFTSTPTQSDPAVHTSSVNMKISQGATVTDTSGFLAAPLTAALTVASPDCPSVVSGTGTGTVTGSAIALKLSLSDGGSLSFSSSEAETAKTMLGAKYSFDTGTCSPQSGTASVNKQ